MGVVRKRILLLLCAVAVLFILGIAGWQLQEQRRSALLYKQQSSETCRTADKLVELRGETLANLAFDYTYWDEMVSFVKTRDPKWAKNSLVTAMTTYGADAITVCNPSGVKVYSVDSFHDSSLRKMDIRPEQIRRLFAAGPFRHFFLQTRHGLLEVRGATVVPSADVKHTGRPRGYFLVFRMWDSSYVEGLGSLLDGKASLQPVSADSQMTPGEQKRSVIVFRKSLCDPDGRSLQTLCVTKRFTEGDLQRTASRMTIILMAFFAVLMIMVLFFGLSRFVGRPLGLISSAMEAQSSDTLSRLEKDQSEFGLIATLIRKFFLQRDNLEHEVQERTVELRKSEESLSTTLRSIGDAVISTDVQGRVVRMNPVAEELTGWVLSEAIARPISEVINIVNVLTGEPAPVPVDEVLSTGKVRHLANHTTLIARDGTRRQIADSAAPIRNDRGAITGVVLVFSDVTEQHRIREELRESEERYRTIWEGSAQGILIADSKTKQFTYANPSICRMLGYTERELLQLGLTDIHPKDSLGHVASEFESQMRGEKTVAAALPCLRKDGTVFYTDVTATPMILEGARECLVGFFTDITERKRAEKELLDAKAETEEGNRQLVDALRDASEMASQAKNAKEQIEESVVELAYQATHDALTGLPNRQYLEQHLSELITGSAGKKSRSMAVLFLDLDRFKLINDTLGHKVGDLLLVEVAGRLQLSLRSEDLLARMGGDEFTVILPRCRSRSIAESVASRIIDSISRPFEIQGHRFVIGASIGLASYPSDGTDAVSLLKHADAAMYKAKQAGRETFCWFTGDVDVDNQQRADMEMDIRAALEKGQFNVYYQPVVSLEHGDILAAEALLRWEHPEKGMISPSLFIPIAEEIGLIGQIGDYVLRTACAQTTAWRDEGINLSQIGVNVSTRQVRDASWLDSVSAVLSDTGIDARCLNLEVTETDFAADYESMRETLREVRELGIGLSIDDFGMGQSSLSRLKDFPVIRLKIDGSFVRDIEHNKNDDALVRSIVEMAHGQGIKVTAEWVETESQMEILRSIGCDFAQGYFISPALPADTFGDFIREWTFAQRAA